jgi:myo-inositol-1(or 4)-monophosphatase
LLEVARLTALDAARAAATVLRDGYPKVKSVRLKKGNPADIVTEYDVQAERAALGHIKRAFPDHNILAEEEGTEGQGSRFTWLIDPLDGTTNYSQAIPAFCVSIALVRDGRPVLGVIADPMRDEVFYAETGKGATLNGEPVQVSGKTRLRESVISVDGGPGHFRPKPRPGLRVPRTRMRAPRMAGSAALDLAYVACGRLDMLYNREGLSPWDFGAGAILVIEGGGAVTNWDKPLDFLHRSPVLAGSRDLHARFLELAVRQAAPPWKRLWWRTPAAPRWLKLGVALSILGAVTWKTSAPALAPGPKRPLGVFRDRDRLFRNAGFVASGLRWAAPWIMSWAMRRLTKKRK